MELVYCEWSDDCVCVNVCRKRFDEESVYTFVCVFVIDKK